jgi:hypothetical protein
MPTARHMRQLSSSASVAFMLTPPRIAVIPPQSRANGELLVNEL